ATGTGNSAAVGGTASSTGGAPSSAGGGNAGLSSSPGGVLDAGALGSGGDVGFEPRWRFGRCVLRRIRRDGWRDGSVRGGRNDHVPGDHGVGLRAADE